MPLEIVKDFEKIRSHKIKEFSWDITEPWNRQNALYDQCLKKTYYLLDSKNVNIINTIT
jgi:hypothetical protein